MHGYHEQTAPASVCFRRAAQSRCQRLSPLQPSLASHTTRHEICPSVHSTVQCFSAGPARIGPAPPPTARPASGTARHGAAPRTPRLELPLCLCLAAPRVRRRSPHCVTYVTQCAPLSPPPPPAETNVALSARVNRQPVVWPAHRRATAPGHSRGHLSARAPIDRTEREALRT